MRDEYVNDKRITDPEGCVGLTVARVKAWENLLLLAFEGGRFFVARAVRSWENSEVETDGSVEMTDALNLGLIGRAEYDAWDAEYRAQSKAQSERYQREQYERLRAKFGGGWVDPG